MRTPKINQLYQLIDWLNNFEFNIEKKPLDSSPLNSNAWLSGLIDSDGHFSVRASGAGEPVPRARSKGPRHRF